MKKMEIVKQPKWVETMDDNIKHYKLPLGRFIKNVVFRNRITKEIIIAVIRGDLDINKTKLEHVLNAVGQLETAMADDLARIGTKAGYVHSWGHKGARYIGDLSLQSVRNLIGGQKEDETDSINVNYGRDFTCEIIADIAMAKDGFSTEDGGSKLIAKKGIEVGNIFQLGYHYTKLMKGATFIDEDGKQKSYYMGCYGIGIGRTLAAIVEKYHDDKGIIWPEIVAPYQVHLISIQNSLPAAATPHLPALPTAKPLQAGALQAGEFRIQNFSQEIYTKLSQAGIEVLWDDRENVSAGEKFADADLIGIPWRVVVSPRLGEKIELKRRNKAEIEIVSIEKLVTLLSC